MPSGGGANEDMKWLHGNFFFRERAYEILLRKKGFVKHVEWYMARLVDHNGHQKDMCYNKIGLCA